MQRAGPEHVAARVTAETLARYKEFWACGGCGQVYWEGPLWEKARRHFRAYANEEEQGALAVADET